MATDDEGCSFGNEDPAAVLGGGGCDGNGYCKPFITADEVDGVEGDDGDGDGDSDNEDDTLFTMEDGLAHKLGKAVAVAATTFGTSAV